MKPEEIKDHVVQALEDMKAHDVRCIDIKGISDFADFMIVASGTSDTHVKSLARSASDTLRKMGVKPLNEDGADIGEWVLVDFGDVVLHVMRPEVRDYYDLEKLWDEDVRELVKKHRDSTAEQSGEGGHIAARWALMHITIVAVGTRMPRWVEMGFDEYAKRMPSICGLSLIEIPAGKRGKNADIPRILRDEAVAVRDAVKPLTKIIALDRKGKSIDTLALAAAQQNWIDETQDVAIVIGGPEGIDQSLLSEAHATWSLSALTFAHPLVRVMLAEQLYRAWSINANLPYHRGD